MSFSETRLHDDRSGVAKGRFSLLDCYKQGRAEIEFVISALWNSQEIKCVARLAPVVTGQDFGAGGENDAWVFPRIDPTTVGSVGEGEEFLMFRGACKPQEAVKQGVAARMWLEPLDDVEKRRMNILAVVFDLTSEIQLAATNGKMDTLFVGSPKFNGGIAQGLVKRVLDLLSDAAGEVSHFRGQPLLEFVAENVFPSLVIRASHNVVGVIADEAGDLGVQISYAGFRLIEQD